MEMDRKTVFELAAAVFIILSFTAGVYAVSQSYADTGNETTNSSVPPAVSPEGGLALVGTIAAFILLVAAVGLFMYTRDFDEEDQ